jgi:hypothetical protein
MMLASYAAAHAGNLGDDTDAFDGSRYTSFTPDSNPAAVSSDGAHAVWINDIRVDGDTVFARVEVQPAAARILSARVADANGDGILTAGETGIVSLRVVNDGGLVAREVRARVSVVDTALTLTRADVLLGDVDVGRVSGALLDDVLPALRLDASFTGTRHLELELELIVEGVAVDRYKVLTEAAATFRLSGRVTDPRGVGLDPFQITITRTDGWSVRVHTDPKGRFGRNLPPGTYDIEVTRPGAPVVQRTVKIERDEDLEFVIPDAPLTTAVTTAAQTLPNGTALAQSYPNPFNAQTLIPFRLARSGNAQLTVYNLLGQRVRVLIDKDLPSGAYVTTWNAIDAAGHPAVSGIYVYRLRVGGIVLSHRMVLLR